MRAGLRTPCQVPPPKAESPGCATLVNHSELVAESNDVAGIQDKLTGEAHTMNVGDHNRPLALPHEDSQASVIVKSQGVALSSSPSQHCDPLSAGPTYTDSTHRVSPRGGTDSMQST